MSEPILAQALALRRAKRQALALLLLATAVFIATSLGPRGLWLDGLKAVAEAAGGSLADVVKLNVFLTDLANFAKVNETMKYYFNEPFPARAAVGVKELPRGALVEADAVMFIGG